MKRTTWFAVLLAACGSDPPVPPPDVVDALVPPVYESEVDAGDSIVIASELEFPRVEPLPAPPPAPLLAPQPADGCDPNYSDCVPIASDVDCAGGSGNGPAYVDGPIRVIGRDVYGLDGDGDGIGCDR